ncbi:MAG TPA: alpha/beta fold hydrolase [Candidatus Kapabacteria bacterium]|nr:alpha/beta fold hydrolase [Candidatus Kapabacteria bacterium]
MKNMPRTWIISAVLITGLSIIAYVTLPSDDAPVHSLPHTATLEESLNKRNEVHPMSITALRNRTYPGSSLAIEQTLPRGTNYEQYIASYQSDGLKIFGLLTIPVGQKPERGYPAIVFVHGYIPPSQYSTTKNYATYQAVLAKNSFVTFKPDLRGHGKSEGEPVSAHFSESYVVDTLNAISSLRQHPDVDPQRIGYWGHSNGGEIGLRSIVISHNIKAAVLWAGVVGSFVDMLETYNDKIPFLKNTDHALVQENGLPSTNLHFWNSIDPYSYLHDIETPIQLHHGTTDSSVPVELSRRLTEELKKVPTDVEYYEYPGDDHNISQNFSSAWQRTINFYKTHL